MDKLDPNSPAFQAVNHAQKSGELVTVIAGVNKKTGQIVFVPVTVRP
jgi:filamentous hemagglutinin